MEYSEIKISIIVPIYNVEKYLCQCVDSIVNQSYKNLEIILVDDGSTDSCPIICDEYQKKDNRIIVIHKENGGLSDARNIGLDAATGDYIGFVDSDDYIDETMFECLIEQCLKYDVPMSSIRFDEIHKNHIEKNICNNHIKVMSSKEYLENLAFVNNYNFITFSVWTNLYRRDIIGKLRFPKGRVYEDIVFNPMAVFNADKCVYIDKCLYHYRIRDNSITQYSRFNRFVSDKIPQFIELFDFLNENDKNILRYYKYASFQEILPICKEKNNYEEEIIIKNFLNISRLSIKEIIGLPISISKKLKAICKHRFTKLYLLIKN